jgi:hypothetical protein
VACKRDPGVWFPRNYGFFDSWGYIAAMLWHNSRGRPRNAPAAFIHPCRPTSSSRRMATARCRNSSTMANGYRFMSATGALRSLSAKSCAARNAASNTLSMSRATVRRYLKRFATLGWKGSFLRRSIRLIAPARAKVGSKSRIQRQRGRRVFLMGRSKNS